MKLEPSLPYNSKVQILQRSWNRGVWESVTSTARTKGPSSDSSRGWIVKTSEDQKLEFICPGEPIVVSEPERRIRGKTTLKSFLWKQAHQLLSAPSEIDHMSKHCLEDDRTDPESVAKVIRAAAAELPVSSKSGSNPAAYWSLVW